ncbi:hypothetical protein JW868_01805, partial [Candidatus Woesearchaeota archaeon]|nr:hypothetical protein [Candidatus Woesearchaeota archaeon]
MIGCLSLVAAAQDSIASESQNIASQNTAKQYTPTLQPGVYFVQKDGSDLKITTIVDSSEIMAPDDKSDDGKQKEESPEPPNSRLWSCNDPYYLDWPEYNTFIVTNPDILLDDESHWFRIDLPNDDEFKIKMVPYDYDDYDLYIYPECNDDWICRPYYGAGSSETCYVEDESGDIYIRVHMYWQSDYEGYYLYIVPTLGNENYCELWDDWGYPCEYGEYICNYDSECDSGLDCVSYDSTCWSWAECGCCDPGEYWDDYDNECVECDNDGDCNDDWDSGWQYSCSNTYVKKYKIRHDWSCDDGECVEDTYQVDVDESSWGDGDFCAKSAEFGCGGCIRNGYDCDWDDECSDSLYCKGNIMCYGAECGCCYSDEDWESNSNTCVDCVDDNGCDDDWSSDWLYHCSDTYVKKYKIRHDWSCQNNDCIESTYEVDVDES